MKKNLLFLLSIMSFFKLNAQLLRLPDSQVTNYRSSIGRTLGVTDIAIQYGSPAVRGREGNIWGTNVVPYGFTVLGYGSNMESPWRAGANEATTIAFSTDVSINGQKLLAGKYGFLMAVYPDSCVLIFNKNSDAWGGYFYDKTKDALRVATKQQKNQPLSKERMDFTFNNQTDHSIEIALEWERWRIPFNVEVDIVNTTLASIQSQMSGAMGFDPPSLQAAAEWCLNNNTNYEQAMNWITSATDPNLGGVKSFAALSTQSGLLNKLGKKNEADAIMKTALESANAMELHGYGRKLLTEKKVSEAMSIFEKNYKKNDGKWPTTAGMMRGLSASGNLKEALKYAKLALAQAPDAGIKKTIEEAIKKLESGQGL